MYAGRRSFRKTRQSSAASPLPRPLLRAPGRLPTRVGRPESIPVGPRVDRVAEDVADRLPARRPPVQLPAIGPGLTSHRQPDPAGDQGPQDAVDRPLPVELVEDQADDVLDLLVRVERDLPGRRLDVPGRDADDQLPATGLVQLPLVHPLLEDVQLRLVHHAGQPEQQAIRVIGRVVHPVGVGEQDAEAGAQLEQVVPVLAGPGQPAHLQPEDQPDPIQGDLGEQPLEPRPALDRLAALAQVVVDHLDLRPRPAEGDGAVGQGVLAGGGFPRSC